MFDFLDDELIEMIIILSKNGFKRTSIVLIMQYMVMIKTKLRESYVNKLIKDDRFWPTVDYLVNNRGCEFLDYDLEFPINLDLYNSAYVTKCMHEVHGSDPLPFPGRQLLQVYLFCYAHPELETEWLNHSKNKYNTAWPFVPDEVKLMRPRIQWQELLNQLTSIELY